MPLRCFPSSFGSIQLMVWEEMSFEEFQDGHHGGNLGYQNRMILAILNLYVAPMPPIVSAQSDFIGDIVWRISRWSPWWPSWISECNNFSNSESLCCSDASHQVLAQSDLWFGRKCHLKNFKMAAMASFEWICLLVQEKKQKIDFSRWPPSWIFDRNDFSFFLSTSHLDASYHVLSQLA